MKTTDSDGRRTRPTTTTEYDGRCTKTENARRRQTTDDDGRATDDDDDGRADESLERGLLSGQERWCELIRKKGRSSHMQRLVLNTHTYLIPDNATIIAPGVEVSRTRVSGSVARRSVGPFEP